MNPTAFYDAAVLALECVCTTMDAVAMDSETYPGCPCRAYISAGTPAFDDCCSDCEDGESHGQLTVEIADAFQSDNFPSSGAFVHPCKASSWVVQLVVTVARCDPAMSETAEPPTPEALSASAELLATDLWAIVQGLTCCLTQQAVPGKTKRRVALANVGNTEIVSEGGCAGVEVRVFVEVGSVCGCPQEVS